MSDIKLTELEQDFMQAICEGEVMYLDHIDGYVKKIRGNQMSGVVSSLIKKGIIKQWIDEEFHMSVIAITEKGMPFSLFKGD